MQNMCTKSDAKRVLRRGPDSIVLVFQEGGDRHNIPFLEGIVVLGGMFRTHSWLLRGPKEGPL